MIVVFEDFKCCDDLHSSFASESDDMTGIDSLGISETGLRSAAPPTLHVYYQPELIN